jgi:hypothetical protein
VKIEKSEKSEKSEIGVGLTDYHAKYFAYELTKQGPADSVEKLAGALADAQVHLNPSSGRSCAVRIPESIL